VQNLRVAGIYSDSKLLDPTICTWLENHEVPKERIT